MYGRMLGHVAASIARLAGPFRRIVWVLKRPFGGCGLGIHPRAVATITGMNTWDEAKRVANLAKHELDFAVAEGFDWDTALTAVDERRDYG